MTMGKKPSPPPVVTPEPPAADKPTLREIGGTGSRDFNIVLWQRTSETMWRHRTGDAKFDKEAERYNVKVTADALKAFAPTDGIEAMIASQAVALHFASIECLKRAMIPAQPSEVAAKHRKDGANLARAMVDMVEALDRKRGKGGRQTVVVKHVHVNDGGQAIIGNVSQGDKALGQAAAVLALDHEEAEAVEPGGGEG
jgi:hypothetical protein